MPTQNSTLPLDANGQPYHRTWLVLTLLVGRSPPSLPKHY